MFKIENEGTKKEPKKQEKRFQRHFRKFHNKELTGHPQYVFDENGNKYKIIGITESERTNGVLNIRLSVNPEPESKKKAYVRPFTNEVDKGTRNEKLKGWKFSTEDKKLVQEIIDKEKSKKNRKKRKKKK